MTAKDILHNSLMMSDMIMNAYVGDFSDADMMVRGVDGMNHGAWQLGHLIASENKMMNAVGATMPALPDGFAESHSKETALSDNADMFLSKDEYLALRREQRDATLAAIEAASESDFDQATPEEMHAYAKTVGAAFNMIATHEMMHAPQLIAVRRKLGKPVVI